MFQFPGLALTRLCVQRAVIPLHGTGLSHSEIHGSTLACSSPRLIAAYHVLHRLLMPRHPPYAISNLALVELCSCTTPSARCFTSDQSTETSIMSKYIHPLPLQRSEEHTSELQSRENLV